MLKNNNYQNNNNANQILVGPYRVFPGRLSVSRSFGDLEAKQKRFGGLPNVVIAVPDIISFKIEENMDFIVLGCDGVFDQLNNEEVTKCVWITEGNKLKNVHEQCGMAVDMIIKTSLMRKSLDNVTSLVIAFPNFERHLFGNSPSEINEIDRKEHTLGEVKYSVNLDNIKRINEETKETKIIPDDIKRILSPKIKNSINEPKGNNSFDLDNYTYDINKIYSPAHKHTNESIISKNNYIEFPPNNITGHSITNKDFQIKHETILNKKVNNNYFIKNSNRVTTSLNDVKIHLKDIKQFEITKNSITNLKSRINGSNNINRQNDLIKSPKNKNF